MVFEWPAVFFYRMDIPIAVRRSHCADVENKMESVPVKQEDGAIKWLNNKDQCHRIDGPAIVDSNGSKYWCLNDRLHREDGPDRKSVV